MSSLEKILAEIKAEAAAEADQTIAAARAKAEEILAAAHTEANAKTKAAKELTAKKKAEIEQSNDSAIALQRRRHILAQKRMLLDETLLKAKERVYNLPDSEYFSLLVQLAAKNAYSGDGTLIFNKKDRARLPADFQAQLAAALPAGHSLAVGDQSRPIDGGFVLIYGDVEENCSIAAIFDARADEFGDLAYGVLFS